MAKIRKAPGLKGNLIEVRITSKPGYLKAYRQDGYTVDRAIPMLQKNDALEMTGRVQYLNFEPGGMLFEAFFEPDHKFWVRAKMNSWGMYPHAFITPRNWELDKDAFF